MVGLPLDVAGSTVRVNVLVDDVATDDDFFQPEEGHTLTSAEIEACAGPDGFSVNPFYWLAFLDDGTSADPFLFGGDLPTMGLAPGGCVRGTLEFEVPATRSVASVVMIDVFREEEARWDRDGAVEPEGRLVAGAPPAAQQVGQTLVFGTEHQATVRSVADGTEPLESFNPPAEGRQYSQIEVELCAGAERLAVNPVYWVGITTEGWAGSSALLGDTLTVIELAPGECTTGLVEVDVPEGQPLATVVMLDELFDEAGRWVVG